MVSAISAVILDLACVTASRASLRAAARFFTVFESSSSGDGLVECSHIASQLVIDLLTVLGHLSVGISELLVGPLGGSLNAITDGLDDFVVASLGRSIHSSQLGISGLAGGLE